MGKAQELNKWIVAQIWRYTTTATQCNTLDPTKDSERAMERETEREKWKVIIAICERSEKKSMTIIIIKYKNQRKYIRLHTFTFAHCQTIHTYGNSSKSSCSKLENANGIHNSRNGFFFLDSPNCKQSTTIHSLATVAHFSHQKHPQLILIIFSL